MNHRIFWLLISAGFVLRLVLMPVTAHSDLLYIHYFPSFFSQRGVWDVYGYFGDYYLSHGYTYYPPLVYYLIGFGQWFFSSLAPGFGSFVGHVHELMSRFSSVPFGDYLKPIGTADLTRLIFFMKLPYLLADLAILSVLATFFWKSKDGKKAALFWWFNPVVIFSSFIFGQYRILSALVLWLVLLLVQREKKNLAFFFLGVLTLMENFPAYLLLPSLLVLGRGVRERGRLLLFYSLPLLAVLLPLGFHSKGYVFYAYFSPLLQKAATQGITRHFPELVSFICKSVLLLVYGGALFFLTKRGKNVSETKDPVSLWSEVCLVLLLAVYATSATPIHYFMWAMPFFLLVQTRGEPWPRVLTPIFFVALFIFNLDSRPLNAGLLAPLNPDFFPSLPSLHEVIDRFIPWGRVVAVSRLLFSGLCLYFIWEIYSQRIKSVV